MSYKIIAIVWSYESYREKATGDVVYARKIGCPSVLHDRHDVLMINNTPDRNGKTIFDALNEVVVYEDHGTGPNIIDTSNERFSICAQRTEYAVRDFENRRTVLYAGKEFKQLFEDDKVSPKIKDRSVSDPWQSADMGAGTILWVALIIGITVFACGVLVGSVIK